MMCTICDCSATFLFFRSLQQFLYRMGSLYIVQIPEWRASGAGCDDSEKPHQVSWVLGAGLLLVSTWWLGIT